jgi:hypothetical protein
LSEFHNYIVLVNCPVEKAAACVRTELVGNRKWEEVSSETPGAKFIEIWRSRTGLTVVELLSEIESDPALAKTLSRDCGTPVGMHFYESTSGVKENLAFDKGKKLAIGKSTFVEMAKSDGWAQLEPDGPSVTLSFRDAKSERVRQVMDLVREFFEPLLHELSMKPAKILPDYPAGNFAIGYALDVQDGTRVVVRYTVPTDGPITIDQDIWHEKNGGKDYDSIYRGGQTQFVPHGDPAQLSALLKRECQYLAARFVTEGAPKIEDAVPSVRPLVEVARRGDVWQRVGAEMAELVRRRNVAHDKTPDWVSASVVFKGAQLVMVQAEGLPRFTFRFDTSSLVDSREVAVGALWESWAGTVGARRLKVGNSVFTFDYDGKYSEVEAL